MHATPSNPVTAEADVLNDVSSLVSEVVAIAESAGEAVMTVYAGADLGTRYKEDDSPLTRADLASHRLIKARLEALTPHIPVLSEESKAVPFEERRAWSLFWLVDPLDGTKEFVKRNGEFTVNIALVRGGKPIVGVVHAPALGSTYWAATSLGSFKRTSEGDAPIHTQRYTEGALRLVASRSHAGAQTEAFVAHLGEDAHIGEVDLVAIGSALKLCLVAEGAAHLYPRFGPTMEWDTAAAQCVVEAAGGEVTDLDGRALRYNKESLLNPFFLVSGEAGRGEAGRGEAEGSEAEGGEAGGTSPSPSPWQKALAAVR